MKKKILIITTAFAPKNVIGAIRITKLVKYLERLDYDITVISPELDEYTKIDKSLLSKEIDVVKKHTISQSDWFVKMFLKKRNVMLQKQSASNYMTKKQNENILKSLKALLFTYLQFIYTIIRNLDWKKNVISFIKENYVEGEFDFVLSSYPALGDHWAANWVRKNKFANTWFADFRDPINYETNSTWLKLKINTSFQNRILSQTDYATCISKDLFKKFNSKYHYKLKFLPNGFDTDDLDKDLLVNNSVPSNVLTFCYVGSLYGGTRSLKSFFKGLKYLIEQEDNIDVNSFKLVYAGSEFNELYKQASQFNLTEILEDRGRVSRTESISIQNTSDMIIVVTWNTIKDQGILTGKLFECFLTQKTILGIVNGNLPNSEFKNIIHEVDGGFAFEDASLDYDLDFKKLTNFIYDKFKEKNEFGILKNSYNNKLENFDYKNITKKLVSFIND
ncbi:glycosyl transferase family 1 [Patiriisocius marinus]|uniref:Glycosyl transferase family 1 n=1 Tax=Patiriisocius marinus TaxID=1397112 RepID=A0A5J4J2R3_9FLAO|nr:hypothetical protein [Patiriisocius marinus]GER60163.1 glycosyl transferase family 1 [Patiriisocius marinus]